MAPPKRKSPEKKPVRKKEPPRIARLFDAALTAVARHPRLLGGLATFGVVFSFVATNALWYQPKHHPAPLLATRMFGDEAKPRRKAEHGAADEVDSDPGVTTFRIERQTARDLSTPAGDSDKPRPSPLVKQIQAALSERGLYDGAADGVTGPKTTAAILFFQETEGLEQTGEPSAALLARIKARDTQVAVIPDERPSPDVTASTKNTDDVADLIRAADTDPAPAATKVSAKTASPELVMQIQRALTKFAYANVKVDGVAGEATRAAIRSFEKNYRLPVTGEPSERLLKKMKSLGVL